MADSDLKHGDPRPAGSSTGEPPVEGAIRARLRIEFDLDLSNIGGPVIPNVVPPPRIVVEVVRALFGDAAVSSLPPQPNVADKFLPAPKPAESGSGTT